MVKKRKSKKKTKSKTKRRASVRTVRRYKRKKTPSVPRITDSNFEKILVENFVSLQKVMTNLSGKFAILSSQISKLLSLFEISAKTIAEKELGTGKSEEEKNEIISKMETLLEQNKILAKGLTLMHNTFTPIEQPRQAYQAPAPAPHSYLPEQYNVPSAPIQEKLISREQEQFRIPQQEQFHQPTTPIFHPQEQPPTQPIQPNQLIMPTAPEKKQEFGLEGYQKSIANSDESFSLGSAIESSSKEKMEL